MNEVNCYHTYDASVVVGTVKSNAPRDPPRASWGPGFRSPDWETFNRLVGVLERRGFTIGRDPRITKQYPSLDNQHRLGCAPTPHGDLWVHAEVYPAGCKFEFFQEVVIVNSNGGRYDFDRVAKMPYLIRKKFEGARRAMLEHLAARGFARHEKAATACVAAPIGRWLCATEDQALQITDCEISAAALAYFNDLWDGEYEKRRGSHRFERGLDGWPSDSALASCWRRTDADGERIEHGQVRCIRDRQGYIRRGRVFGGINGMWMVVFGPGRLDCTHVSAHELFAYRPGLPRKLHPRPVTTAELLKRAVDAQEFERAIIFRDMMASADRRAA